MRRALLTACGCLVALAGTALRAQAPIAYRLTFPEPEHHWMQVEASLTDLPATPLELHMSRSSPGRYAIHEFAKNVYDVRLTDTAGAAIALTHLAMSGGRARPARAAGVGS